MRTRKSTITATEAVAAAQEAGQEVDVQKDARGSELLQRPVSIDGPVKQVHKEGRRVRVYNKRRSTLFCTDCKIPANSEAMILETDLNIPGVRDNVIKVA